MTNRHFPFVALGRSESGGEHAWVDLDFEAVADAGVARRVALGHRRIAQGSTPFKSTEAVRYRPCAPPKSIPI
ncbi:hypothetical protein [Paraburkholderia fynbosensis]|uniref:Uncharacterized protein n=1 Tax=Paraburkholderia fynbosensis TaxID=1200993 RepID=A0A6J5H1J8_9BURK|nr:hypothetical protein [Paraburkholderia fynbosensis]CAB3810149.1 hypothetical protein LMG27177_07061 [Paraburkholderia fynbosensis]